MLTLITRFIDSVKNWLSQNPDNPLFVLAGIALISLILIIEIFLRHWYRRAHRDLEENMRIAKNWQARNATAEDRRKAPHA